MNAPGPGEAPGEVLVDARGLRCPAPVIRLARAARELPPGTVLTVWWTDPAARHDIPAWARMRGHEVLTTTELGPDELRLPDGSPAPPAPPAPAAADGTTAPVAATRVRVRAGDA